MQEERIDIMAGEGMNEDEARFRVMTGKEPDELDRKLGFDFIPYQLGKALTERENGYKIADDNETVEAVTIPDDAVPEFKTRSDLRNWLIGKFNEIGNVTINSTGANVEFNKTSAQRAIKNARQKKNNIAYPEIEKVVSGAKYSGFREADERHQNVKGQDVYHSGVVYKGVPYSVEFYVDVPLHGNTGDNFAGNKISKIEIASADTQVTSENQNRPANNLSDAISNISLAVLRGKVKPARYDASTSTYYQVAFAGSRADYDEPSLEAIGTGEGAHVQEKAPQTVPATNPGVEGLTSDISEDALNITPLKQNVDRNLVVTHATTLDKNVHLTVKKDNHGNFFWDAQIKESPQHATPATNPRNTGAKAEQSACQSRNVIFLFWYDKMINLYCL